MVYPSAIPHKSPPGRGFCSSNTFPALEDQSPLETVPPTLSKSDMALLSEVAAETDADVYGAQLARTKAAKVTSAQQLVERAMADHKVIKGMLKPEGGRGKGKGKEGVEPRILFPKTRIRRLLREHLRQVAMGKGVCLGTRLRHHWWQPVVGASGKKRTCLFLGMV